MSLLCRVARHTDFDRIVKEMDSSGLVNTQHSDQTILL